MFFLCFNNTYIQLLKSYLQERKQYVSYNGFNSNVYTSTSGVPQGSNLGPLLFVIFINDLCTTLKCDKLFFADDLKVYASINNVDDCIFLQKQLQLLHVWCQKNLLYLNINKCKTLTYSRKTNIIKYRYMINNVTLERTNDIKDLGINFDSQVTFNIHFRSTVTSAYRTYGFIIRNCNQFSIQVLSTLYFSLVRSKLEY